MPPASIVTIPHLTVLLFPKTALPVVLLEEITLAPFLIVRSPDAADIKEVVVIVPPENTRFLNLIPTAKVPIAPASKANSAALLVPDEFHSPTLVIVLVPPTNFNTPAAVVVIIVEAVAVLLVPV